MASERLSGHVRPVVRDGREVRGLWRLVVALPVEVRADGSRRYPKTQRTVRARGKREAEGLLADWIREIREHACTDPRRLTVAVLCERWLEGIAHEVRPATLDFYAQNVRDHVRPAIGGLVAAEVRPSDLTRLYAEKRAQGLGETSVRHVHSTVSACYSWAMTEELVDGNPAQRVKRRHRPRQAERPVTVWSQAEIVRAAMLARSMLLRRAPRSKGRGIRSPSLQVRPQRRQVESVPYHS